MNDDFDEDTLENIYDQSEVIEPIAEMRRKKVIQDNIFTISRENYGNSTDEQVEAWFTKFEDVIIDDSADPYKDPLTKKELAFKIISKLSIDNLNKGIDKFNNGVNQFSKVIASNQTGKHKKINFGISQKDYDSLFKSKRKGNSMNFWNEDKKTRKRRNKRKPVQNKGLALYSERKMKFF